MSDEATQLADDLIPMLRRLQRELSHPATHPITGAPEPKMAIEQVRQLKAVIDEFRLFLWAYLDSWARTRGETSQALQRIRMGAVVDMLHALETEFRESQVPDSPEFERLMMRVQAFSKIMTELARG